MSADSIFLFDVFTISLAKFRRLRAPRTREVRSSFLSNFHFTALTLCLFLHARSHINTHKQTHTRKEISRAFVANYYLTRAGSVHYISRACRYNLAFYLYVIRIGALCLLYYAHWMNCQNKNLKLIHKCFRFGFQ